MISEPYDSLARATWRRDFLLNPQLILATHRAHLKSLASGLRDAASARAVQLHPKQAFDIAVDGKSVSIKESSVALATCYINGEAPGRLSLQFFDNRAKEVVREELKLDCYGDGEYVWHTSIGTVSASDVPGYIVAKTMDVGIDVVRAQTPGEQSAGRFVL